MNPPVNEVMETWPALLPLPGVAHGMVGRVPEISVSLDKAEVLARLQPWHDAAREALGFPRDRLFTAEQVHGGETARITSGSPRWTPGVDGLMTDEPGLLLGIHTADCAPVFIVDPVRKAIALLHSGRKSTEAGITPHTIRLMADAYGSRPADLVVQIAPCIRPPLFETDIAATIRRDALRAGVPAAQVHDCGTCTGSQVDRYYSYRVEKGKTGRLLSLLGMRPDAV
ncbi:MAG: laccase domain-containing protein [Verrucomicrobiaceae bacterium]|nr:MAG: laccase domain-containing protein [Verrucomicrobiaceae bacterium]